MHRLEQELRAAVEMHIGEPNWNNVAADERARTLALLISRLPDEAWYKLSMQAQAWGNDAIKAIRNKLVVPPVPDWDTLDYETTVVRESLSTMPADVFAVVCKARLDALVAIGFNSAQAMELVCASLRGG